MFNNILMGYVLANREGLDSEGTKNVMLASIGGGSSFIAPVIASRSESEKKTIKAEKSIVAEELETTRKAFEKAITFVPARDFAALITSVGTDEKVVQKIRLHQPVQYQQEAQVATPAQHRVTPRKAVARKKPTK